MSRVGTPPAAVAWARQRERPIRTAHHDLCDIAFLQLCIKLQQRKHTDLNLSGFPARQTTAESPNALPFAT